ncbi:hypothetical protein [Mesorhizobium sp. M0816]|uniref:hypothetical protein n=1 Tax=Mesorhizobium sp. M0816 TaxID=2957006 RepID=UPI00333625D7
MEIHLGRVAEVLPTIAWTAGLTADLVCQPSPARIYGLRLDEAHGCNEATQSGNLLRLLECWRSILRPASPATRDDSK